MKKVRLIRPSSFSDGPISKLQQSASREPVRIANVHDQLPGWHWVEPLYVGPPEIKWHFVSTQRSSLEKYVPGLHFGRVRAATKVRSLHRNGQLDLVVSHGPYTSLYTELMGGGPRQHLPHLAFAFNFTDLPKGSTLLAMRKAYSTIDRFVVYSRMERQLYSEILDVPVERFVFLHWGVAPPISQPGPREIAGNYVAALGGEARDYATLCQAARLLPDRTFVLVTRPDSLNGVDIPPNVSIYINLPWDRAWSIMWHADVVALPLRSKDTPNGHVTGVGSMHLGKAQVVTDSAGIRDYFIHDDTALLVPERDPVALAASIARAQDDLPLQIKLGQASKAYAEKYCSETITVEFLRRQLSEMLSTHSSYTGPT